MYYKAHCCLLAHKFTDYLSYHLILIFSLTILGQARLLQMLCEVADSVKEDVFLRYAKHHTTDLNKDRESLRVVQIQTFSNTVTYVLGTCVGADFEELL